MVQIRLIVFRYFKEASIHGLKYLAEDMSVALRLLWMSAVVGCFSAASLSYYLAWMDWTQTPLVTTIHSVDRPARSIQFPTITICSRHNGDDSIGITRTILNSFKYACSDDQDCEDTLPLRRLLLPSDKAFIKLLLEDIEYSLETPEPKRTILNIIGGSYTSYTTIDIDCATLALNESSKDKIIEEIAYSISKGNALTVLSAKLLAEEGKDPQIIGGKEWKEACALLALTYLLNKMDKLKMYDILPGDIFAMEYTRHKGLSLFHSRILRAALNELHSFPQGEKLYETRDEIQYKIFDQACLGLGEDTLDLDPCVNPKCCPRMPTFPDTDLWKIMTVMKLSLPHSGYTMSPSRLMSLFNVSSLLGFPLAPADQTPEYLWNEDSVLLSCSLADFASEYLFKTHLCDQFLPTPTNDGICYAFNTLHPVDSVKQGTSFSEAFNKTFQAELHQAPPIGQPLIMSEDTRYFSVAISSNRFNFGANRPSGPFFLRVSDVFTFFNFKSNPIEIEYGMETVIFVQPWAKVSEDIDHLPIDVRGCRFHEETINDQLSIFNFYSKDTCLQECKIANAIQTCGCIPWDMPFSSNFSFSQYPVCSSWLHNCFSIVQQKYSEEDFDLCRNRCPSDCNRLQFDVVRVDKKKLDADPWCQSQIYSPTYNLTWLYAHQRKWYPNAFYAFLSRKNITLFSPYMICKDIMENDIGVATIRLASPFYTQFSQTQKVDLNEKISFLGGTLGLFTGMSFLSLVESVFWLFRLLNASVGPPQRNATTP